MNTYIMAAVEQIKKEFALNETISFETVDSITGKLEMVKMEIEQHIANMPQNAEYRELRCAAQNTVQNLSEILVLLEDFSDADKEDYQALVCEVLDLLVEISY